MTSPPIGRTKHSIGFSRDAFALGLPKAGRQKKEKKKKLPFPRPGVFSVLEACTHPAMGLGRASATGLSRPRRWSQEKHSATNVEREFKFEQTCTGLESLVAPRPSYP